MSSLSGRRHKRAGGCRTGRRRGRHGAEAGCRQRLHLTAPGERVHLAAERRPRDKRGLLRVTQVAVGGREAGSFRKREVVVLLRGVGRGRPVIRVSRRVERNVMTGENVSFQVLSGVSVSGVTGRSIGEWLRPLRTTDLIIKALCITVFLCHHAGVCKVGLGRQCLETRKQNTFLLNAKYWKSNTKCP